MNKFDIKDSKTYPKKIPLFVTDGLILLPRGILPVRFDSKEKKEIIDAALLSPSRIVGVIQIMDSNKDETTLYKIGCAGRIIQFEEDEDKKYSVLLRGISRFELKKNIFKSDIGLLQEKISWNKLNYDNNIYDNKYINRNRLLKLIDAYSLVKDIELEISDLHDWSDEQIVNALCIFLPIEPPEKQALLDIDSFELRANTLLSMLEMSILEDDCSDKYIQ